jgi:hypothetical protein
MYSLLHTEDVSISRGLDKERNVLEISECLLLLGEGISEAIVKLYKKKLMGTLLLSQDRVTT